MAVLHITYPLPIGHMWYLIYYILYTCDIPPKATARISLVLTNNKLVWSLLYLSEKNHFLYCKCDKFHVHNNRLENQVIVARLREPRDSNVGILENKPTLLTISRLWRYCGPSNYRFNFLLYWYAPWVFFEVANVLSCSPFMFENTENKQLNWRIRHSHLVSTLFHSLVRWWRPRRIRLQITRLSQLENSPMGTWPIYKNSIYQTGSKNGVI